MKKLFIFALTLGCLGTVSCNQKLYETITLEKTKSIISEYKIDNSCKAKDITASGYITKFNYSGNIELHTVRSSDAAANIDIDEKEFEVNINNQRLANVDFPFTFLETIVPNSLIKESPKLSTIMDVSSYLSRLPLNDKLLMLLYGFKIDEKATDPTKYIVEEEWTTAKVTFYNIENHLDILLKGDDLFDFLNEANKRTGETSQISYEGKLPFELELGFDEHGFVEGLSFVTSVDNFKYTRGTKGGNQTYFHIDGGLSIDIDLNFKRTFYKPVTIQYEVVVYKTNSSGRLVVDSKTNPTSDLGTLSEYIDVKWFAYNNWDIGDDYEESPLADDRFDNPLLKINYWDKNKSIAFEKSKYDISIYPSYSKVEVEELTNGDNEEKQYIYEPKYIILDDKDLEEVTEINNKYFLQTAEKPVAPYPISIEYYSNKCTFSYNGKNLPISESSSLSEDGNDGILFKHEHKTYVYDDTHLYKDDYEKYSIEKYEETNFYVPGTYINSKPGDTYVVSVAVLKLPELKKDAK